MKARVHVYLKPGVLDPQGQAVSNSLNHLGFNEVAGVRQGKLIEIDLNTADAEEAQQRVAEMCDKLLANPVIENYDIELSA
ncbi:MAG: phosphoribosylformylglycinamidine synthase [Oceanicaulis sp.]|jgi:phosphoribosylformylglycinamidine synthase|uniref:phosphoribosylformylglycinamidine synthase subunit PurS n=1 Tax=unclassified Oceanicaulis TaxID=2632123 RepID=UPI000066D4B5|nr:MULTISPECIES: phosphoribosylformylglycinamidine synthase subunit PurS [unclassified Oceanicaulis]EAP91443.1 Component of phosphoribosylformylglycinamidine (FGAM) synthetase [Oceanicaulis sp. HTCC2633]MAB70717.1 phosphoribosylformylglycinamidine synthase [Oceanicaulis sp.]MBC39904.1 phosphoribosylformylglycinamidine synthase [Oceanicaulis sp.]MBG36159.1 phosphoribosylformylglycinamidine synthase [Oceanicaulis sp.]HBU62204.1 phosphoribosylformylglycinamidine synthase subunit PurS [Oceanicauli|tara:strand:- start:2973 stop:3215 length:243 start_codon:yes stop_codon:yes gene_type:complete